MPFIMSANEAARRTLRIIRGGRFRTAFPKRFAFLFYIANILPDWIYFKLFRKTHRVLNDNNSNHPTKYLHELNATNSLI